MSVINFYSTVQEYGVFSNFARYPLKLDDKVWPTSEHYFQAQKFVGTDKEYIEQIRKAKTPSKAAELGRDRSKPLRRDWESVKLNVMRRALYAKFTQHKDLQEILLGTGDAKLVEHTERDNYWGDGGDGSGHNWLGKLLMELRDKLRNENVNVAE